MAQKRFQSILIRSAVAFSAAAMTVGLATSASAQLTYGRIRPAPQKGPSFTACLSMEGDKCRLIAPTVAISIGVQGGDAVISYLDPSQAGYVVQRKESVALDLEKSMAQGTYGSTQSALIFAELLSMHELMYRLPANQAELKRAMGFPPQIQLSASDQVGVLTSHLQLTLGVSAITADYLVSKLGLRVVEDEPSTPAAPPAPVEMPAVSPEPAREPQPLEPALEPQPSEDPNLYPDQPIPFEGSFPVSSPKELNPEIAI